jgi:hypothetical protein
MARRSFIPLNNYLRLLNFSVFVMASHCFSVVNDWAEQPRSRQVHAENSFGPNLGWSELFLV